MELANNAEYKTHGYCTESCLQSSSPSFNFSKESFSNGGFCLPGKQSNMLNGNPISVLPPFSVYYLLLYN
ncbi:hypothetical protein V2J09_014562 [Rumex salicifolius]